MCHFLSGIVSLRIDCLYLSWKVQEFLEIQIHYFLIIITMVTNNFSIFCSSLNFLHFGLLSGDGGATTWTIFMCHLFWFSFCWWDLNGRFIVGTVFSFQVFFPTLKSLFVILLHFQERKKAQKACQISPCYRESPSLNRFHRVYWTINFSPCFKTIFHLGTISFAIYSVLYWHIEIIHTTENTIRHCRFEKHWIKHYGNRLGVFFIL